jgi:hypothetical protein
MIPLDHSIIYMYFVNLLRSLPPNPKVNIRFGLNTWMYS